MLAPGLQITSAKVSPRASAAKIPPALFRIAPVIRFAVYMEFSPRRCPDHCRSGPSVARNPHLRDDGRSMLERTIPNNDVRRGLHLPISDMVGVIMGPPA
jgi:hypothetical protein